MNLIKFSRSYQVNQKGFGLVPVLLILILLSVVGFTGYYVYDKQSNKKLDSSAAVAGDTSSKLSPNPTVTPTAKATATPTVAASPNPNSQKYLVIKEWGVKIPLSTGIEDAAYSIINEPDVSYLSLYKTSFVNESATCKDTPQYRVVRFADKNSLINVSYLDKPTKIGDIYTSPIIIGGINYAVLSPQADCGSYVGNVLKPSSEEQKVVVNLFRESLNKLQQL